MKTTFGEIYSYDPCSSGWVKLCTNKLGTDLHDDLTAEQLGKEISIMEILTSNGIKHAVWALRTQDYRDYCLFIADVAESVLHIFENEYPEDMRLRNLIAGIRRWHAGDIYDEELDVLRIAAVAAAYYAADADAAYYAAVAAYYATDTTAYAVAYAAAYAAAYADAYASAYASVYARREQWQKVEMLLRKHLK